MDELEQAATDYIKKFKIILGSSSKSRASVLNLAGIPFTVQVADIDEKAIGSREPGSNPNDLVLKVARAKADALIATGTLPEDENVFLVTCDQVALWEGQIREKPENEKEAREFLASYSKAPAETRGGMIVVNLKTKKIVEGVDVAKQHFTFIPEEVIDKLIVQGSVYHCCGAFMIDDPLLMPYLALREGDEDSIIGLSKKLLAQLIHEAL
ncbi:inosine triphosphate pyrophosphatase-like protein [Chytridium lagenaria]|nr:inosine triphosphate pyrophosphatase-like protein [Chytridium lagenaria]